MHTLHIFYFLVFYSTSMYDMIIISSYALMLINVVAVVSLL